MDKGGRFKTPGMKEKVVCVFQRNKESSSQMLKTVSTHKHFSLNKKGNGYLGIGQFFLLSCVLKFGLC